MICLCGVSGSFVSVDVVLANTKSGNFAYKDSTILTNHRFPGCRIFQDIYEIVKTVMTYNDSIQSNNMYFDNVSTEI